MKNEYIYVKRNYNREELIAKVVEFRMGYMIIRMLKNSINSAVEGHTVALNIFEGDYVKYYDNIRDIMVELL